MILFQKRGKIQLEVANALTQRLEPQSEGSKRGGITCGIQHQKLLTINRISIDFESQTRNIF